MNNLECTGEMSKVYIQYNCEHDDETIRKIQVKGQIIAANTLVVLVVYLFWIHYIRKLSSIDEAVWDHATTTAADFTMQIDIPEEFYTEIQEKKQANESFTDIFHDKLLAAVDKLEKVFSKEEAKDVEIKISNISYGHDNGELIELLMKRGNAFKDADFKKIQNLENNIFELIV